MSRQAYTLISRTSDNFHIIKRLNIKIKGSDGRTKSGRTVCHVCYRGHSIYSFLFIGFCRMDRLTWRLSALRTLQPQRINIGSHKTYRLTVYMVAVLPQRDFSEATDNMPRDVVIISIIHYTACHLRSFKPYPTVYC